MTFLAFGTRATGLLRGEAAAGVAGLGRRRRRGWVEEGGEEVEEDEEEYEEVVEEEETTARGRTHTMFISSVKGKRCSAVKLLAPTF